MRMTPHTLQLTPVPLQDMTAEIAHWRSVYPHSAFFSQRLQFERYLPTFAFAYKTFVFDDASQAVTVPSQLCFTYKDGTPACDRIDWKQAEMIISATWARLRAADLSQEINLHRYASAHSLLLLVHDKTHAMQAVRRMVS